MPVKLTVVFLWSLSPFGISSLHYHCHLLFNSFYLFFISDVSYFLLFSSITLVQQNWHIHWGLTYFVFVPELFTVKTWQQLVGGEPFSFGRWAESKERKLCYGTINKKLCGLVEKIGKDFFSSFGFGTIERAWMLFAFYK